MMPPKKKSAVQVKKDEITVVQIGSSEKNSDWLKKIDGGKYQFEDLEAHDAIEDEHQEGKL